MEKQNQKPKVQLSGQDGNVFNLISICSRALRRARQNDKAEEMKKRIFASGSYDNALQIMMEYCEVC